MILRRYINPHLYFQIIKIINNIQIFQKWLSKNVHILAISTKHILQYSKLAGLRRLIQIDRWRHLQSFTIQYETNRLQHTFDLRARFCDLAKVFIRSAIKLHIVIMQIRFPFQMQILENMFRNSESWAACVNYCGAALLITLLQSLLSIEQVWPFKSPILLRFDVIWHIVKCPESMKAWLSIYHLRMIKFSEKSVWFMHRYTKADNWLLNMTALFKLFNKIHVVVRFLLVVWESENSVKFIA